VAQLPRMIEVTDDSGFLGVVDPDAYATYVSKDWTLEQLFGHFRSEMEKRTLLLWGTGMECIWRVEITDFAGSSRPSGFRRASGPIRVTEGRLLLVNYETLTMAAQFADVSLPEQHLTELLVDVPSGDYTCEITQLDDPDMMGDDSGGATDFILKLTPGRGHAPWSTPVWFERDW
jgi:hypothetical protein